MIDCTQRSAGPGIALLALVAAATQGCSCEAYMEVSLADAAHTYAGAVSAMVLDTVPLVAQSFRSSGDGECTGGPLGPDSRGRPSSYRWSSSAPAVARVLADGRVVAVSPGHTVVTASWADEATTGGRVELEVLPRIDSITIRPLSASVSRGDTVSFLISEWAGATRLPVRFPGIIDPHLREQNDSAYYTMNMIRVDPSRVLLRGERQGTARLHAWSLTWNYSKIPQDTATLTVTP